MSSKGLRRQLEARHSGLGEDADARLAAYDWGKVRKPPVDLSVKAGKGKPRSKRAKDD